MIEKLKTTLRDSESPVWPALVVLTGALVFFAVAGTRCLWSPDEPRVAGICVEMARTGEWLVPKLNGEAFLEQPPLYYWISAAMVKAFGASEYVARLPSLLSGLLGALLTYLVARNIGSSRFGAFVAAFVLCTFSGYWSMAQRCVVDMTMCFFITAAMFCFHMFATRKGRNGLLWAAGFAAAVGGAVMTKGLVGLAIPSSALFFWLVFRKDFSFKSWAGLFIGAGLSLVPVCIWLAFLRAGAGREAFDTVVWTNNLGRFTGSHSEHVEGFFYYFEKEPTRLLPWLIFIVPAVAHLRKSMRDRRDSILFVMCWFIVPFALLSMAAGKRSLYLLPLDPAAALLLGMPLAAAVESITSKEKITHWAMRLFPLLAAAGSLVLCVIAYSHKAFVTPTIIAAAGAALGWMAFSEFEKNRRAYCGLAALSTAMIFMLVGLHIYPLGNKRESFKPLFAKCAALEKEKGGGTILVKPPERLRGAATFHMGKILPVVVDTKAGEGGLAGMMASQNLRIAVGEEAAFDGVEGLVAIDTFKLGKNKYRVAGLKDR